MYRRAFLSTWDADDDLAFFSKDTKPQPAEEWAKVLAWVRGAEPSVLWRWEPMRGPGGYEDPTGERVRRLEAVVTRRFEAGEIVLVLSRIDTPKQPTPEGEAEEEGEEEGEGEGEEAVEDVEVGAEEVTSLIEILQGRLEPLRKTGNADRKLLRQPADNRAVEAADSEEVSSRRREYVAMYREGLRDVLREAVESLQEMLLGAMADSEGEDEEGVEADC